MGPDELDMKIEVKRLSRESRRQAEKEKGKRKKRTGKRHRQTERQTSSPEEKTGIEKQEKSSFSVATLTSSALQILQSLANVPPELRSSFICFTLSVPRLIFLLFIFFPFTAPYFFTLLVSIKCQVNFLGGMSYTLPCASCVCERFVCKHTHVYVRVCVWWRVGEGGRNRSR